MGRKKKKAEEQKPWCWYCDREFLDEPTLVQHQKNKHFKCPDCNRKLNTAQGLCVHAYQVHKRTITEIPAALPGREGVEREIFGMAGVPPGARPGNPFGDEGEPSAKKARTELAGSAPPPPLPPGVLQNGMSMSGPMGMGPAGHMGPGMGMPMPGHMGMVSGPMGGPPPPPMGVPPLGPPLPPPRPGFMGAPGMGLGGPPLPPPRPGFGPPGMGYGPPGMVPPPRGPPGAPVSGVPPPATVAPGGPPPPVPPVPPPGMMPAGAAGMGMVPPPGIRPPGGPLFPISGPSSAGPASSGPSSGGAPQQQPLFPVMGAPAAAGMPGAAPGALATAALVPAAAADGLQPHQQPPVAASEMRLVWADDEYSMEERRSMLPKYAAARQRAQQKGVGFNGPGIPPQHLQTAVASN